MWSNWAANAAVGIVCAWFGWAGPAWAGSVSGTVALLDGTPVVGATVRLKTSTNTVLLVQTDAEGRWAIVVGSGRYHADAFTPALAGDCDHPLDVSLQAPSATCVITVGPN